MGLPFDCIATNERYIWAISWTVVISQNHRGLDHDLLRLLTRSSGILSKAGDRWSMTLWLPGGLQRKVVHTLQCLAEVVSHNIKEQLKTPVSIILQTGTIRSPGPAGKMGE